MADTTGTARLGSQLGLTAESLRTFLADDASTPAGRLARYVRSLDFIAKRAAELATEKLDGVDLFTLLLNGWATAKKVREAGKSTREMPSDPVQVRLASATMSAPQEITFKIKAGGLPIWTEKLVLDLKVEFEICLLTIKGGAVVTVDLGSGVPSIALKYRDKYVVEPRTIGAVTFGRTDLTPPIPIP